LKKRCLEVVENLEDIIIDAILPNGKMVEKMDATKDYNGWEIF
jgi:hypothetical protein